MVLLNPAQFDKRVTHLISSPFLLRLFQYLFIPGDDDYDMGMLIGRPINFSHISINMPPGQKSTSTWVKSIWTFLRLVSFDIKLEISNRGSMINKSFILFIANDVKIGYEEKRVRLFYGLFRFDFLSAPVIVVVPPVRQKAKQKVTEIFCCVPAIGEQKKNQFYEVIFVECNADFLLLCCCCSFVFSARRCRVCWIIPLIHCRWIKHGRRNTQKRDNMERASKSEKRIKI